MAFFYPTNRATTSDENQMKLAGINHSCQFAKLITAEVKRKWEKNRSPKIDWFQPRHAKALWEGKFGVPFGQNAVKLLKEARNALSV